MMRDVRDLQHRFAADGRDYVIEVCAPGRNPAPVSAGPFDVHIVADVPKGFDDDDAELESVVGHVVDYVTPLLPSSVSAKQWYDFSTAIRSWVLSHRQAAACLEWEQERHQLAWRSFETWRSDSTGSIVSFASDDHEARRRLLPDAKLLFTVYGETMDEAREVIDEQLGKHKRKDPT